jgi:hypothetical protein
MSIQSCAPPASLALWIAALMAGAGLFVVMALALAPLELRSWRVRGITALRLLGALLAVALAGWSLLLRSHVQAMHALLASREEADPYYCIGNAPGHYHGWQLYTAALIAPLQRQALIATVATVAFLLVVVALIALRWLRDSRQVRRLGASIAAQVNARWRLRLGRGRALALLLLSALIVASLGEFTLIQVRSVQAQMALTAPCPSTMTEADVQQLQAAGVTLTPAGNTVPVDAQAARAASRQGLGALLPTRANCIMPQLDLVNDSSVPGVPRFAIVWVVGYRIPGAVAGPGVLATPPSEEWTFIDAQSGVYLYGMFISSVGG